MTVADTLRAAANYIREHGWVQGLYDEPDGACAIGGLMHACGEKVCGADAFMRLPLATIVDALRLVAPRVPTPPAWQQREWASYLMSKAIAGWNDAEGQTKENVIAGLEYAALWWEEREKERQQLRELAVEQTTA